MIQVSAFQEPQDISLAAYGTADGLVALAKVNGLGLDAVLTAGQYLEVDGNWGAPVSDPDLLLPYVPEVISDYQALILQSLTDVAVQELGSADGLVALCKLNGLALDDALAPGQKLKVGDPVRVSMKKYLADKSKYVITDTSSSNAGLNYLLTEDGRVITAEDGIGILI